MIHKIHSNQSPVSLNTGKDVPDQHQITTSQPASQLQVREDCTVGLLDCVPCSRHGKHCTHKKHTHSEWVLITIRRFVTRAPKPRWKKKRHTTLTCHWKCDGSEIEETTTATTNANEQQKKHPSDPTISASSSLALVRQTVDTRWAQEGVWLPFVGRPRARFIYDEIVLWAQIERKKSWREFSMSCNGLLLLMLLMPHPFNQHRQGRQRLTLWPGRWALMFREESNFPTRYTLFFSIQILYNSHPAVLCTPIHTHVCVPFSSSSPSL